VPFSGNSAGACVALSLTINLQNVPLIGLVAVTGTLDLLGRVGRVGGLEGKIWGANKGGFDLLLVPKGALAEVGRLSEDEEDEQALRRWAEQHVREVETFVDVLAHAIKGGTSRA
jgi:predicted ATP-dependent protease